jgi:hypothetical protein
MCVDTVDDAGWSRIPLLAASSTVLQRKRRANVSLVGMPGGVPQLDRGAQLLAVPFRARNGLL